MEKYFKSKNVLITGGLGFIGSTLAIRLVELGANVEIVDSLMPSYGGNHFNINSIKNKVQVNISDVRDQPSMNQFVKGKDYIFNLAGTLSHIDSMKKPIIDLEINCVAQLSILEASRKNNPKCKILFAGTRGQYGKAIYIPVDENHPMQPTDVNGINNIAGESYHILYNNVYDIRACSLRLTNTYGPRHQMRHHKQGIINWFVRQIIDGEKIKLYGDGNQIRDINFVDDVVDALLVAMYSNKTNGEVYNLGGNHRSLIKIVKKMIDIHGGGCFEIIDFPNVNKKIEIGNYIADYSKFSNATGWKPRVDIDEGLRKTFEYYKKYQKYYWELS